MAIRFTCPRCQTPNSWPIESIGSEVRCPQCSKRITIPASLAQRITPVAPVSEASRAVAEAAETFADAVATPQQPALQPPQLTQPAKSTVSTLARVCYALLMGWVALCVLYYMSMQGRAQSAIQQAAISADAAAMLIGGYVFVRAIEKLTQR
jgi:hypothetical protein